MNFGNDEHEIILRRYTGDLDIFFEVFWKETYHLPANYPTSINSILDLGANTGLSAAYFYRHFPLAGIYCVEPDQKNMSVLKLNVEDLIPKDNIHLLQAAVGRADGEAELVHSRYAYNQRVDERTNGTVTVLSMNSILSHFNLEKVDLVKMDIEGAESLVLTDDRWLKRVRAIFIEFHSASGLNNGLKILSENKFRCRTIENNPMLVFAENTIF